VTYLYCDPAHTCTRDTHTHTRDREMVDRERRDRQMPFRLEREERKTHGILRDERQTHTQKERQCWRRHQGLD